MPDVPTTPMILAVLILALARPALAQTSSRQSDEDACRPDVFRLCVDAIPDEGAIVACLNRETSRLSPACRAVIAPDRTARIRRSRR